MSEQEGAQAAEEPLPAKTLMVGLPGTGKTSFLALLFLALVHDPDGNGPTLTAFEQDRAYLNRIAQKLQRCEAADRTQVGDEQGLSLIISMPEGKRSMGLAVPDLSGETWEVAHVERVLDESIWKDAATAAGFMLFASVTDFEGSPTIEEGRQAAALLGQESQDWKEGSHVVHGEAPSATQVVLVDLIQILSKLHDGPFNLSIVLSAYDTVDHASTSPSAWVEENAPLLAQFLQGNESQVRTRIYGVSAQGGDYDDDAAIEELAERTLLERAFVLDASGQSVGVHIPLLWALGDA
ncbi:TRAFAC clade GTPase domain-containing protein [Nocardioides litoris]|uniref:TRAFAC clade GTPase domain-containing protein n=1 Tax=Nocardioides litoris TaxID=1926648 RepID=UPI00111F682E|nr:hypothetical protein [Nocardioides litoris]